MLNFNDLLFYIGILHTTPSEPAPSDAWDVHVCVN